MHKVFELHLHYDEKNVFCTRSNFGCFFNDIL